MIGCARSHLRLPGSAGAGHAALNGRASSWTRAAARAGRAERRRSMGCRSDVRPCAPIEPSTPRAAVAADPGRVRAPAAADPTPVLRRHSVDFGARVDEAPDAAALRDPRGDLRVDRSRRRGEGAHVDPAHPGHEGAVQRSRRRGRPRAWPAAGWAERTNLNTAVTVPDCGQPVSPPRVRGGSVLPCATRPAGPARVRSRISSRSNLGQRREDAEHKSAGRGGGASLARRPPAGPRRGRTGPAPVC